MSTFGSAETRVVAGLARIRSGSPQDAPPDTGKRAVSAAIGGEGVAISRGFRPMSGGFRASGRERVNDSAENEIG